MAIATTYNHAHDGGSSRVDSGCALSPLNSSHHHGVMNVGPGLMGVGPADCDACVHCADVCDKEGCISCREKTRRLAVASACGGEPTYTMCEIRRHQSADSAWLVAGGYVYDATAYIAMHPGGDKSILKKCGGVCDCTQDLLFHSNKGQKLWKKYRIGRVKRCCPEDAKFWWMFWK